MSLPAIRLAAAAALLAAAGCGQAPKAPPSSAVRQAAALEANRKGEAYVGRGELEGAARSYAEALRLSQSLEDAEGIAANAVNLSIVRQRQGRLADARGALSAVTDQENLRFSPLRQAEIALRHALLDLDERTWAPALCGVRCPWAGSIHMVRALLALPAGRGDAAAASARAALEVSRAAGDRAETANAMRILGVTALRQGDAAAARARLEQALALDREIPPRSAATAKRRAATTPAPSP
jgi:tetratricopeptide (TPR) repeat protein